MDVYERDKIPSLKKKVGLSFSFPLPWLEHACGGGEPSLALEKGSEGGSSQTFWSHDPFTLRNWGTTEFLFLWVISIFIYHIRNLKDILITINSLHVNINNKTFMRTICSKTKKNWWEKWYFVFGNLFNVCLREGSCTLMSVALYLVLDDGYEENSALYRYSVRKEGSKSGAFSDYCGYSSLTSHQNSTSSSFFKVSYTEESGYINGFFILFH